MKLLNLGPKSLAMLQTAGITQVSQIETLGAVRTYIKVKSIHTRASLNLLWALEGALTNRRWQDVAQTERLSLLLQLEDYTKPSN